MGCTDRRLRGGIRRLAYSHFGSSEDFEIDLHGDVLSMRGGMRVDRQSRDGRWRVVQCANGMFRRDVARASW